MPVTTRSKDTTLINDNIIPDVIGIHANSKGEDLSTIFKDAKANQIWIGDFNVDLSDLEQLEALRTALEAKNLRIDISQEAVDQLKLMFKIRSKSAMYSQQILKNNVPSLFIKDIGFKLINREDGDDVIPKHLENKLKSLNTVASQLKKEIKNVTDLSSIDTLCKRYDVINYHDQTESHFHDHIPTWYHDDATKTLVYAINSIKQSVYNYDGHFASWDPSQEEELREKYNALEKKVLIEFYKLLLIKESNQSNVDSTKSTEELRADVNKKLKETGKSTSVLSKEQYQVYLKQVLSSDELKAINGLLKTPFVLDDVSVESLLETKLLDSDHVKQYNGKIERLVNLPFQALDVQAPNETDQAISLNGTGFDPFKDENGFFVNEETMREAQINSIVDDLNRLKKSFPSSEIALVLIEGKGQLEKIEKLNEEVNSLNQEVASETNSASALGKYSFMRSVSISFKNSGDKQIDGNIPSAKL